MSTALILAPAGLSLTESERRFFHDADPWGFIVFARNIDNPAQVLALTDDLRATVGRNAVVLVDQEGGRVQRLRAPHWREWMPPLDEAAIGNPRSFYLRYALIADELRQVGIDVNCAPCCDVAIDTTHPFLRNRCLGTMPDAVVENARAAIAGHLAGGCLPVVKHAPGHGRALQDSHMALPRVDTSLDDLLLSDFKAFSGVADASMVMSAHVIYSCIDGEKPGTMSAAVIDAMRAKIGLQGLLISDDLSMNALSGTLADRTVKCLTAGCDIALHCSGKMDEMIEVAGVARVLGNAALDRANRALAQRPKASTIDSSMLLAEYRALTGGA